MQHANVSRAAAKPSLLAKALDRNPAMLDAAIRLHQEGAIPPVDAPDRPRRRRQQRERDCGGSSAVQPDGVCHDEAGWSRAPYDAARTRSWFRRCHCGRGDAGVSHPPLRLPPGERGTHVSTAPRRGRAYPRDGPTVCHGVHAGSRSRVSEACVALGRTQPLYVTVGRSGDEGTHPELFGGWDETECVNGIRPILDLPNVFVAGIAQHVTIDYASQDDPYTARPTEAFFTALRARERLERELGLDDLRINCSGNCNAVTAGILASYGATDIEPGAALVGSGTISRVARHA